MGADEAKASDTTKILPASISHVWVDGGHNLVCRVCGSSLIVHIPARAENVLREIRGFMARHARCSK